MLTETLRPTFPNVSEPPYPRLSYGLPFYESCSKHVRETFHAKRPYIIASNTLSKKTPFLSQLQDALGDSLVGTWIGIRAHTPLDDLIPIIEDMEAKKADCLITIGGGSLSDGAKLVSFVSSNTFYCPLIVPCHANSRPSFPQALANNAKTIPSINSLLPSKDSFGTIVTSTYQAPSVPIICIPITLFGGEYSRYAGITDPQTHVKNMFTHPCMYPSLVILDTTIAASTPVPLWLSTGIRSIDHCVEGLLSTNARAEADEASLEGLKLLINGLICTKMDLSDPPSARLQSQLGANLSLTSLYLSVWKGASHGIGHQLGPFGVGHGETSCILLPAVCKYNASVNYAKQNDLKEVILEQPSVHRYLPDLLEGNGDLGDVLRTIFDALGMPRTLKEVGVGREKLSELARNSLKDHYCHTNPKSLETEDDVLRLLEMVVE